MDKVEIREMYCITSDFYGHHKVDDEKRNIDGLKYRYGL